MAEIACFCGAKITGNSPVICPQCKTPIYPWATELQKKIKDN